MFARALLGISLVLLTLAAPLTVSAASADAGGFCSWFGWAVRPLGWCQPPVVVSVPVTPAQPVQPEVLGEATSGSPVTADSPDTVPPEITHKYVTIEQYGVTTEQLNARITEVLQYINSLPHHRLVEQPLAAAQTTTVNNGGVDREYVLRSIDKVYETRRDTLDAVLVGGEFDAPTLLDVTTANFLGSLVLSGNQANIALGNNYLSGDGDDEGIYINPAGNVGLGTSTPPERLSLSGGAIYLGDYVPAATTNRIYANAGSLYWNGAAISGAVLGNWDSNGSNAYRLTGNVGIGTSTPGSRLAVVGDVTVSGTVSGALEDMGGQVCNVNAYGAVGDNATLNDAAIAAAIAACPVGGTVYFPLGQYRIAAPIVLDKPVTLRGAFSPRWSYSSTPRSSIRADFNTFSGVAIVHVRDRTISGQPTDNNGGRLEYLSLDGGSASTDVNGVYFEGLVRDWKLTDVDISQVTGNGFEAAVGGGSGNPRGFTIRGLSIYSADGHGFRATALNDSYIEDLLSVGNALRGIYLSSMGETKLNNSRAVFNGLTGLYIDGASSNGGLMFTDFSTDRNDRHGVRISLTGTTTVTFNGLLTRRDGANLSGGSETPYAGVTIIGSPTEKVAPVFINGLSQIVGVDDSGNPPLAPLTGVRVLNAKYVKVEGQLWGVNEPYRDDGGNEVFLIEEGSIVKTGTNGVNEAAPTLYHNKWVAATTSKSLSYDGQINIGSSTDSRLLNIVAASGAGARFRDTTNNVIFDMRAEDFQGFFGTFSNHQLRFQTNNLSRLTIDTSGRVGIGTTAPDQVLDVIGTMQASNLLGGSVGLSTDANGNIIRTPSDRRLKTNVTDIEGALDIVLALRGVRYQWLDTERFGAESEIGFLAQEVDDALPEVVRKGGDYWSLNTANIVAVVVEALQEMWEIITGNQEKIARLEERVQALEASVGAGSGATSQAVPDTPPSAAVESDPAPASVAETAATSSQPVASSSSEIVSVTPDTQSTVPAPLAPAAVVEPAEAVEPTAPTESSTSSESTATAEDTAASSLPDVPLIPSTE